MMCHHDVCFTAIFYIVNGLPVTTWNFQHRNCKTWHKMTHQPISAIVAHSKNYDKSCPTVSQENIMTKHELLSNHYKRYVNSGIMPI